MAISAWMAMEGEILKDKKVLRSFVMISQIGISMMVPIFLCGALGYWLDGIFHQKMIFLLLILLGIGAGFRNMYVVTRSFYAADRKKEHDRLAYMEGLKNYSREHPEEDFSDVMEGKRTRYPDPKGPARN